MIVRPPGNYIGRDDEPRQPRPPRRAPGRLEDVQPAGEEAAETGKGSRLNKALGALAFAAAIVYLGDWPWNGGGNAVEPAAGTGSVSLAQEWRTATEPFSGADGFSFAKGEKLYLLSRRGSTYSVAVVRDGTEHESAVATSDLERRTSR